MHLDTQLWIVKTSVNTSSSNISKKKKTTDHLLPGRLSACCGRGKNGRVGDVAECFNKPHSSPSTTTEDLANNGRRMARSVEVALGEHPKKQRHFPILHDAHRYVLLECCSRGSVLASSAKRETSPLERVVLPMMYFELFRVSGGQGTRTIGVLSKSVDIGFAVMSERTWTWVDFKRMLSDTLWVSFTFENTRHKRLWFTFSSSSSMRAARAESAHERQQRRKLPFKCLNHHPLHVSTSLASESCTGSGTCGGHNGANDNRRETNFPFLPGPFCCLLKSARV